MASLENSISPLKKNYHQSFIVFQKLQSKQIIPNSFYEPLSPDSKTTISYQKLRKSIFFISISVKILNEMLAKFSDIKKYYTPQPTGFYLRNIRFDI